MRWSLGLLTAVLFVTSPLAGPPWISIEYPANPSDPTTRRAVLLVHGFHHRTASDQPISGTAEGLVDGRRKSVKLDFKRTSRPGVFALENQWGEAGEWTLVISVGSANHDPNDAAQAMVEWSAGRVLSVTVPTRRSGEWTIPRAITAQEIEASLRNRPKSGA